MSLVRFATKDDLPKLIELGVEFFAFSPFAEVVTFSKQSAAASMTVLIDTGVVLVAEKDGEVVGAIAGTLSRLWFNLDTQVATELGWWVAPDHRGGTVGIKLLVAFEQWAKDAGASIVALSDLVINGDAPAKKLFEKLGYAMVERSHIKGI